MISPHVENYKYETCILYPKIIVHLFRIPTIMTYNETCRLLVRLRMRTRRNNDLLESKYTRN
jgi:hypothetical protein